MSEHNPELQEEKHSLADSRRVGGENTPSRVETAVSKHEELLSEGQPFTGGNLTDLPSVGSCPLGPWLDGALEATPFSFLETQSCFWTAVFQGTESRCCRNAGFSCVVLSHACSALTPLLSRPQDAPARVHHGQE